MGAASWNSAHDPSLAGKEAGMVEILFEVETPVSPQGADVLSL